MSEVEVHLRCCGLGEVSGVSRRARHRSLHFICCGRREHIGAERKSRIEKDDGAIEETRSIVRIST